jgi:hypothetical protein
MIDVEEQVLKPVPEKCKDGPLLSWETMHMKALKVA